MSRPSCRREPRFSPNVSGMALRRTPRTGMWSAGRSGSVGEAAGLGMAISGAGVTRGADVFGVGACGPTVNDVARECTVLTPRRASHSSGSRSTPTTAPRASNPGTEPMSSKRRMPDHLTRRAAGS